MSNPTSSAGSVPSLTATAPLPPLRGPIVEATGVPRIHPGPDGQMLSIQPAVIVRPLTPGRSGGTIRPYAPITLHEPRPETCLHETAKSGKPFISYPDRPQSQRFFYDGKFHSEHPDTVAATDAAFEAKFKEIKETLDAQKQAQADAEELKDWLSKL